MATGPTWVLESCVLLCKFDALEIHFEMHIEMHFEMHIEMHFEMHSEMHIDAF